MEEESKKEERNGLSKEDINELKQCFDFFDTNGTGKIDPKELKAAMQSLQFDSKNPVIYQLIEDLDTSEAEKNGGVSFEDFIKFINYKFGDKKSEEGLRRIFGLFVGETNSNEINFNSLKKVSKEIGEDLNDGEIKEMLERASKDGEKLTFEEFYDIVTKNPFS